MSRPRHVKRQAAFARLEGVAARLDSLVRHDLGEGGVPVILTEQALREIAVIVRDAVTVLRDPRATPAPGPKRLRRTTDRPPGDDPPGGA